MKNQTFTAEEANKLPLHRGCSAYIIIHSGGMPTVRCVEVNNVIYEVFTQTVRVEYINHHFRIMDSGLLNFEVFLTYKDAAKRACRDYERAIEEAERELAKRKKKLEELRAGFNTDVIPVK
jgi:hypothetical protein